MDDQPKNAFSEAESHILTQLGTVRKELPPYVLNNCSLTLHWAKHRWKWKHKHYLRILFQFEDDIFPGCDHLLDW